jgi:hypothetical protein
MPVCHDLYNHYSYLYTVDLDLDRKGMEYDVPDEIEILPNNHDISSGPDSFDSILLEHKMGTQGTLGTVLEGVDEVIQEKDDGQSDNETQDTEDIIKPENTCTHPLEASPILVHTLLDYLTHR